MLYFDTHNLGNYLLYLVIFSILVYLGWKLRKIYNNVIFFLYKKRGKKAEKKALKLLKKKGFKVISIQPTAKGYVYENEKKISFTIRPDLLVSKDNVIYVAEIKSGFAASIYNINTRRQLFEYSKVFNSNKLILIDTFKKQIKKIEF